MSKQPIFLRVVKGGKPIEMKQFDGDQIVIGREGEVNLAVHDPKTAAIHAMIEARGGQYFLCDLGTEHGTLVRGQKIVETEIKSGDQFVIGDTTIEFHVGIPKPQSSGATPALPTAPPNLTSKVEPPKPAPGMRASSKPLPVAPPPKPKGQPLSSSTGAMAMTDLPVIPRPPSAKGTFAPPSNSNAKESLRPGKGNVIEIVVLWKDRVLTEHHFSTTHVVRVGSHPKNDVILPVFGSVRVSHPLIKIDSSQTTVILTSDMTGELMKKDGSRQSFSDLKSSGGLKTYGANYLYVLRQEEMIKINFGEGVEIVVRYVANAGTPKFAPILDLSVNQLTGLVVSLLAGLLFLFYVFLYAPPIEDKPEAETIPPRKAQFIYKRPVEEIKTVEVGPVPKTAEKTIIDKQVAPSRIEEGAAQEARPNKSQSQVKKLTTNRAGNNKGMQQSSKNQAKDNGAKAPTKDVSKSGLLGVFSTKGVQEQINRANKGAGSVTGAASGATGAGSENVGAGNIPGSGMKELGMGGNGTATVGIAGPQTKGRGGGLTGYGSGPLGGKKNATIIAGNDEATVSGGIDKEAIRRVVMANIKQIKACYDKGLNRDPSLYGKITIQWTIGAGGRVMEAGVKNTTMNNSEVENCAVARLKTWKFPEPPVNEVAVVSYPFVFQAQE